MKKHLTQRMFAVLLSVMMVITMMPAMAFADGEQAGNNVAEVEGGSSYPTLVDAINDVPNNGTVKLLNDCSGAGIFVGAGNKTLTIDLNEKRYTCNTPVGSSGTVNQAFHLEQGNNITIKNGTLDCSENARCAFIIQNYSNLTLDEVTVDGSNLDHTIKQTCYVFSNNCGNVSIKDSKIIAADNDFAFDSCKYSSYDAPTVTVSGKSTINGKVEVTGGTVNLEKDSTVNGQVRVGENKNDGATGGTLNAKIGSTINNTNNYAIVAFGNNTVNVEGKINGIIGTNGNAYNAGSIINIKPGATIENTDDVAIYMPNGELNITGGTIEGKTAVYFKSTKLNITGGTLTGTGEHTVYQYDGNGCNATGDALVIDSCNYPNGLKSEDVTISGGEFISKAAGTSAVAAFTSNGATPVTAVITGGSFSSDVTITNLVKGGYIVKVDREIIKYGEEEKPSEISESFIVVEDKDIFAGVYTTSPINIKDGTKVVEFNENWYAVVKIGEKIIIDEGTNYNKTGAKDTTVDIKVPENEDKDVILEQLKVIKIDNNSALIEQVVNNDPQVKAIITEAGKDTFVYVETHLLYDITEFCKTTDECTLKVDIRPVCKVIIGEEDVREISPIEINQPVKLSVTLPDSFGKDKGTLYVKHNKDDKKTYIYEGNVEDKVVTFTNPHGFSEFTITTKDESVAKIKKDDGEEIGYGTLQAAIDECQTSKEIIPIYMVGDCNGKIFSVAADEKNGFYLVWESKEKAGTITTDKGYKVNSTEANEFKDLPEGTYAVKYSISRSVNTKAIIAIVGGVAAVGVTAGVITAAVKNAKKTYTVSFDTQGVGDPIESVAVKKKGTLTPPTLPMVKGFLFCGWYKEPECITPWDFENDKVTENTILYANWQSLTPIPAPVIQPDNVPVLMLQAKVSGDKAIKLSWNEVFGAEKYVVYGAQCGKKLKKLATTDKLNYTVKKIGDKKLVAHKAYEMYVVAYSGGGKMQSDSIHFVTANTMNKYANTTSVKVAKAKKMLKLGRTYKISATAKIYKNKKHLTSSKHGAKFRYTSNCPQVATVDEKGVVTAVAPGEATIYVQDTCGPITEVVITVYDNVTVDGVHYVLGSDWTYDDETRAFQNDNNENAYYTIGDQWGDEICSSIDERIATFAPDGSDGFELYETTVNGTRALLVCEPVNEIKDYNLFFYANGVEHRINYETDFYYDDIAAYTAELVEGICW